MGDNEEEEEQSGGVTPKDVENFVLDFEHSDPCVVYSLPMFIEAVTTSVALLLGNAAFMNCLICGALKHQDSALVRGALGMLEKLMDSKGVADSLMEYPVLENVVPLLTHEVGLIRTLTGLDWNADVPRAIPWHFPIFGIRWKRPCPWNSPLTILMTRKWRIP